MSARKLSDSDKREILKLYRQPEETTSTLATRYGVSNSTISRFLKSTLSEQEYEALIQQKRLNRTNHSATESSSEIVDTVPEVTPEITIETPLSKPTVVEAPRRKRVSIPQPQPEVKVIEPISLTKTATQLSLDVFEPSSNADEEPLRDSYSPEEASILEEMLGEELTDLDDESDLDDEDSEDVDEEDWEDDKSFPSRFPEKIFPIQSGANVQVLPLSEASLPKTCYLVIDRAAELIARPLRDFSDLGRIPAEEVQQRTLPIFDNHRVARRFSNPAQRVIKVPDGRMIHKTSSHLKAKGITRLLIDGQVYSLSP